MKNIKLINNLMLSAFWLQLCSVGLIFYIEPMTANNLVVIIYILLVASIFMLKTGYLIYNQKNMLSIQKTTITTIAWIFIAIFVVTPLLHFVPYPKNIYLIVLIGIIISLINIFKIVNMYKISVFRTIRIYANVGGKEYSVDPSDFDELTDLEITYLSAIFPFKNDFVIMKKHSMKQLEYDELKLPEKYAIEYGSKIVFKFEKKLDELSHKEKTILYVNVINQ